MVLVRREFVVNVSVERAWGHLALVERWPSWAKHIRQVDVTPAGELGSKSVGVIQLTNGLKTAFSVTEFNPPRSWKWEGAFLWLTIRYDHVFDALEEQKTKLTWVVVGEGFGTSVLGRIFAAIYGRNLDRAIPLLVAELQAA